jgi:hypothetical protein
MTKVYAPCLSFILTFKLIGSPPSNLSISSLSFIRTWRLYSGYSCTDLRVIEKYFLLRITGSFLTWTELCKLSCTCMSSFLFPRIRQQRDFTKIKFIDGNVAWALPYVQICQQERTPLACFSYEVPIIVPYLWHALEKSCRIIDVSE